MKGWAELKEAFWAALEGDPAERARRLAELASIDPDLPARLQSLLDADAAGETLQSIFQAEGAPHDPPARIGSYGVVGLLGFGGMGVVYRAHDDRLHRDVAIKVLPAALAGDPERLARLEREARVLASLNHPHIAQVYGLEDAGGAPALVMELVEGPTLASLIADYPDARPPLARILAIAWQIADGLAAAHEKGFVHRDLKPGNIALTAQGEVRILDFGVAKSLSDPVGVGAAGSTEAGVLLGTPAYMSPEQARGLPIDRRTDIWAFGCVLYELLTGRGPFAALTPSDSLAAVLEREPDLSLLPRDTPAPIRSLLRHCLEKEPNRRLRDIADARLAIEDARDGSFDEQAPPSGADHPVHARPSFRMSLPWTVATLGIVSLIAAGLSALVERSAPSEESARIETTLALPPGLRLGGGSSPPALSVESRFAISPDGRRLVLVASDTSGLPRLWLRELGSAVFQPLAETEDAMFPFWSPDSRSIGFVAAGRLKTIEVYGGRPITLGDAGFQTGSWSRDGLLLFSPGGRAPLHVVPASGGESRPATTLDTASGEVHHAHPSFLPDGRHFLYFSYGSLSGGALQPRGVFVTSLDGSTPARLLLAGAMQARYASGHLLFVQGGTLMAQPLDIARLTLRGAPFPLVGDVRLSTSGATGDAASYSVSDNGVLAYQAALRTESRPVWYDRAGTRLAALAGPADYGEVSLSPDGRRLAVSVIDPARSTMDLWLYESAGGPGQRLTVDPGDEFAPVWSPDGTRLLFSAARNGVVDLYVNGLSSSEVPAPMETDTLGFGRFATDWADDDRFIMYVAGGRAIATSDLWFSPVDHGEGRPFVNTPFVETHGRFAPSGDWIVYTSNETGRLEVYADRFPDRGRKRVISADGGAWPRWSRDGTEIFYLAPGNDLMVVPVRETGERLELGAPRRLFTLRPRPPVRLDAYSYDVSPDGRRFVVNDLIEESAATQITLVLNWNAHAPER